MNIFILSDSPDPADHHASNARYHCDKHVVKMPTEAVQMLVTALFENKEFGKLFYYAKDTAPCRPFEKSHRTHPATLWVGKDIQNFIYTVNYGLSLCEEKLQRYNSNPKHQYHNWLALLALDIETFFHQKINQIALPKEFRVCWNNSFYNAQSCSLETTVSEYRKYYINEKAEFCTWKIRGVPYWFIVKERNHAIKTILAKKTAKRTTNS